MQAQASDPAATPNRKDSACAFNARYSLVDLGIFAVGMAAACGAAAWYRVSISEDRVSISEGRFTQLQKAVFVSRIPDVRVAEEKTVPDTAAYKRRYDFTTDWFTWNIPVWNVVLAPYKGKPGIRYLEIGVYEGRSMLWMLENVLTHLTARLTGIDPFLGPYKEKFSANVKLSGASEKVEAITGYSQVAMRDLPLDSFDIIYIDGSHSQADVLEDAVLSWRLLKGGGVLIFDDYRWAGCFASGTCDAPTDLPKTAIDRFYECFSGHFDVVHNSYQLILRKRVDPGKG